MSEHPRIRSYAARRGRLSALTVSRLETLLPGRSVPAGALDRVATFGRDAPLVLEIGSGHGEAAVAYARAHPGHDLVAAEVHSPGIARMLAAAEQAGVTNLRVWRGDAVELLTDGLGPAALDAVHIFFPDPWPKAKHAKRRLVAGPVLDLLHDRLRPDGVLRLATDHDDYAAHAIEALTAHGGWAVVTGERPTWRPAAGYEAKGRAAGRTITEVTATRRPLPRR